MRPALALLVLATASCASTSGAHVDTTLERRTTGVSYTLPDGGAVNLDVESRVAHEVVSVPVAAASQRVWAVLPQAFEELGIPLTAHDSTTMVVGNSGFNPTGGKVNGQRVSRYLNCGIDPMGVSRSDRYNVKMSLMTQVTAAGDNSVLRTAVTGEATQRGVSAVPVVCTSTGELENALANSVRLRMATQ